MSLKEVAEGTGEFFSCRADTSLTKVITQGAVCGSMILDERFEKFLEDLIGPGQYNVISKKAKESALRYWQEMIKPSFIGKSGDDFDDCERAVPLPGATDNPSICLEGGFLLINQ